ncbi:MAG TPA: putative baseplate assembly protein [Pyrinomonadaceae bacterium]|nr:putative baseplate assembly protein [Pyrinomonadaceae bacterium]
MGLLLPKLDDKPFARIFDDARAQIPSTAPEWTDHNIHDPGITFLDLFAWLAEIEQYRLDRTPASSYARFFSLMGLVPLGPQPAQVTVAFALDFPANDILVRANTLMWSIGNEDLRFLTNRDLYLTRAKLTKVITKAGGQERTQTSAEQNEVGHYEAFGPAPKIGDSLELEFENWFTGSQGQLAITLFEDDLPASTPLEASPRGFEPSAKLRWSYRAGATQWNDLDVIDDSTLNLSRSGELIFRSPSAPPDNVPKRLRAELIGGSYEIPPRIVKIQTNTISARQVETIVNEDAGEGLGKADQVVRLKKFPLLLTDAVDDGPVQVGEVLDWNDLTERLSNPRGPLQAALTYIAGELRKIDPGVVDAQRPLPDDTKYALAQVCNKLLNETSFYQAEVFRKVSVPEEFREDSSVRRCKRPSFVRRFNRLLLQKVFPDLFVSDRLEMQTSLLPERAWVTWERVENFLKSGPEDRHYVLNPNEGTVRFGNGLNGRVPERKESIRARFYRYSQLEAGNLPAGHAWALDVELPPGTKITDRKNLTPAIGGRQKEALEETKLRAREVFQKERITLTAKDYEQLVLNTPGLRVARASVLANFSPKLPTLKLPGEITILVLPAPPPQAAFPNATPPEPSEGFLKTVQNHLESRRLVTTSLHIQGPKYVAVKVSCNVFLKKRASETTVRDEINRALKEFLDPVFGGPEKGKGWPFGRSVFPSEVSQLLAKVPGVDYVTGVSLNDAKVGESLKLPYDGLPTSSSTPHDLQLATFESRGRKGGDGCD